MALLFIWGKWGPIILKYMHNFRSNGPGMLKFKNLWSADLQIRPRPSNFSNKRKKNSTFIHLGKQLCQTKSKSMHKNRGKGMDTLNLRQFYHLTLKCDLDLRPTCTDVSSVTFTYSGKQMPQIVLKSIHNCWSNGLDKLNFMTIQTENRYFPISGTDNSTTTDATKISHKFIVSLISAI